ncbi:SDR family NAD(P)-dependent oxidoreductase [Microlunatus sp. GCM10028923]|uniref:SDR family NAD(P)-dependent oxidoreductase n=1 Tax=Microlunatus sp. GCM10028923 TaxID=3273400 RepID=UPI00361A4F13
MDEASISSGAVSGADRWSPPDLSGSVAVVTGANRGAGRGIARVLGRCGATVYVTGRSRAGRISTRAGEDVSLAETARMVSALGGTGIAVEVDHAVDAEVEVLFTRIQHEQGKLDILVNNAWGGYSVDDGTLDEPFWLQPMLRFDRMWTVGVRSNVVATRLGLPLLQATDRGLVVNTTLMFSDLARDIGALVGEGPADLEKPPSESHAGCALFYRTAKLAINQMTLYMAKDLAWNGHRVAMIALSPGFMRTEAIMAEVGTDALHWQTKSILQGTESTELAGRGVAALATDHDLLTRSGQTLSTRNLAREYGYSDVDGRLPS